MLNNIKSVKTERGFTIVELLIVIVVIAILAAITIVAYNGVQNRAKAVSGQSLANTILKKAEAFNTINSSYASYCQLVTNSNTPTGAAPAAGTVGAGTCVAGGTNAGAEPKIDNVSALTPATSAAASALSSAIAANGTVVSYWLCGASTGANIWYWDYTTSAAVKVTAGAGC